MELHDALSQIAQIRNQIDRAAVYRGFRSAPVAISGMLALLGGVIQRYTISSPTEQFTQYLFLWVMVAVLSIVAVTTEILARCWFQRSKTFQESTMLTLEQLTPSLFAGAILTWFIVRNEFPLIWMLPGLWQLVFSLGLFAAQQRFPKAIRLVALFYLACGFATLTLARGTYQLDWRAMAVPFGVGQLLAASILFLTLERSNGQE